MLTMEEAAHRLGVSAMSVRRLIVRKQLPAQQVVACAPWQIEATALDSEIVRNAVIQIKRRAHLPLPRNCGEQPSMFSDR
jgi:excisionase family DNA binding protein